MQPAFLPCVFTGSRLSTTPQRLWLGAPWAATVQGPRDSFWCTAYSRRQTPPSALWRHEGKPPSIPEGTRGPQERQSVYGHVLEEGAYHCVPPRTAATYQHHVGKRAPCHVHKYVHGENGVQPQRPSPVVVVCPSPRESTTSGKGPIPKGTVKNRGNRKAGPRDGALEREKQPHQPRSNQATGPASKSDQQAEGTGQSQFELTRHPPHAGAGM